LEVSLAYTKYYDRALADSAHDIGRIEAVFSAIRRYYKSIPLAVISTSNHEDVVQLLTCVGALHLFDVVVAQQPGEKRNISDMFNTAAQKLNQPCDLCLGLDVLDVNVELLAKEGKMIFDVKTLPGYESSLLTPPTSAITAEHTIALGQSRSFSTMTALVLVVAILGVCIHGYSNSYSSSGLQW